MTTPAKPSRVPPRMIAAITARLMVLEAAKGDDAILSALFLLHCACRDCLAVLPEPQTPEKL